MKKIIATYIFIIVISKLTIAQEKEEVHYTNQINLGLNHNPLIYNISPVYNFHIGYKKNFKTKYFYRVAFNSGFDTYSKESSINFGIEKKQFFLKRRFKFLYGIDILLLFTHTREGVDEFKEYGIGIGPVVGVEYLFYKKLTIATELAIVQGLASREYIHGNSHYSKYPGYSHRFLGLIINYHF